MPITLTKRTVKGSSITAAEQSADATAVEGAVNALEARTAFSQVAVAGQSDVVADAAGDTLTLVAGTNISLTTDAATDTITIAAAGGGGGGGGTVTATGITDSTAGGRELLTEMPALVASRLLGTDASANPGHVSIGSGLSLVGGILAATGGGGGGGSSDPRVFDVAVTNGLTLSDNETIEGSDVVTFIQGAIDAAAAAGGGTVLLRGGVWWIGNSIRMKSNVRLTGIGWETVIKLRGSVNKHMIVLDATNVEFMSIDNMRIEGNRNAQGVPAGTENIWCNGIDLRWGTSGFTRTDPQCYFWNLFIFDCACDGLYVSGRGGHVFYNVHIGEVRRHGAVLGCWDSIYYGIYAGGPGGDGIRIESGPTILIGCKVFFTGKRTKALTDANLRQVNAASPITPSTEDFRYGNGIQSPGGNIILGSEVQDTCGHGIFITGPGDIVEGARFGNVGSLSEHFLGSFSNARAIADIACVAFTGSSTYGCRVTGVVVDQFTQFNGNEPATCHYICNIMSSSVRDCTVDIQYQPNFIRQSDVVKWTNVDALHNNRIHYRRDKSRAVSANFTLARTDHQNLIFLHQTGLTTISGVAATLAAGFKVMLHNKTGATVTGPGSTTIANNTIGVLETNGTTWTWTANAVMNNGDLQRELRDNYTLNALDKGSIFVCKAGITISGTAATLGNGFACRIISDTTGTVTIGGQTLANEDVADLYVSGGIAFLSKLNANVAFS